MTQFFDAKILFWLFSLIFSFLSYFIYYRSILKWKSKPHILSWLIWWIISLVICLIQLYDGAWFWALNIGFIAIVCFWIVFLSYKKWERKITKQDKNTFILGLLAIVIWIFTNDPFFSVLLLIIIDVLWFVPTFTKSYKKPFEESWQSYWLASLGYFFSILAMSNLSFLTIGFVIVTLLCNAWLAIMIFYRRFSVVKEVEVL